MVVSRLFTFQAKKIKINMKLIFHSLYQPEATYQISERLVHSKLLAKLLKLLQRPSMPRLPILPYVVTSKALPAVLSQPITLKFGMLLLVDISNEKMSVFCDSIFFLPKGDQSNAELFEIKNLKDRI